MQWRNSSHPIDKSFLLTILKAFARLLGIQTVEDVRGQAISEVARAAGIYTSQLFRWRICATPRTTVASLCASSSVSERKLQRPSKRGALTFDVAAAHPVAKRKLDLPQPASRNAGEADAGSGAIAQRGAGAAQGATGPERRAGLAGGPGTPAWVLMGWRCKALDYSLKRWSALTRFLNDGRLRLSYNAVERELRGARTVPFAGFDEGGRSPICWARLPDHPARGGSSIYCRGVVWIAPAGGLTAALRYAMMVRTTREAAMRAQAFAHTISVDQVDVEALLGGPRRRPDRGGVGRRVPECNHAAHGRVGPAAQGQARRLLATPDPGILPATRTASRCSISRRTKNIASLRSRPSLSPPASALAAYWRGKGPKQISMPLPSGSSTKPARTSIR